MSKIGGKKYDIGKGLNIYINDRPSKTRKGKDRVYVSLRQDGKKEWKIVMSRCSVYGFDILLEKLTK